MDLSFVHDIIEMSEEEWSVERRKEQFKVTYKVIGRFIRQWHRRRGEGGGECPPPHFSYQKGGGGGNPPHFLKYLT